MINVYKNFLLIAENFFELLIFHVYRVIYFKENQHLVLNHFCGVLHPGVHRHLQNRHLQVNRKLLSAWAFLRQTCKVLTKEIILNYTGYHCPLSHWTAWLHELRRKFIKLYHFVGPWVWIQARTENVSVIFFCADFSIFSYLKLASDSFGGVHKQYGPKRGRGRLFYPCI